MALCVDLVNGLTGDGGWRWRDTDSASYLPSRRGGQEKCLPSRFHLPFLVDIV